MLFDLISQETPKELHLAASKNVQHHLKKLLKENKVQEDQGKYFI